MRKFLNLEIKRPSSVLFMARRSMSAGKGHNPTQSINSVNAEKLLSQMKLVPIAVEATLPKLMTNKASPLPSRDHTYQTAKSAKKGTMAKENALLSATVKPPLPTANLNKAREMADLSSTDAFIEPMGGARTPQNQHASTTSLFSNVKPDSPS